MSAANPESHKAESLLSIEDLRVDFATDTGWVNVVNGVSLTVGHNEIVGLVGESGSGKSVTSLSVLRLISSRYSRISGGHIWYAGKDLTTLPKGQLRRIRGNDVSMVFQEPMTSLNPAYTIGDQIAEAYRLHKGCKRSVARRRAVETLDQVGIPDAARRVNDYPHEFSGGMRQRAMIAMALVCEPKLIIADEPTTALDVTIQAQVVDLLKYVRTETGCGVLFITHDLGVISEICDRVVVMYAGEIVEEAPCREIFVEPQHPYTEGLLAAMPQLGARGEELASIPGRAPEAWEVADGCRFSSRCGYAEAACQEQVVTLQDTRPGRRARCRRVEELTLAGAK